MQTCKYCGTELEFLGRYEFQNQFHCDFCDLVFAEADTCCDRKRKKYKPIAIDSFITLTVQQMLVTDTITLFHSLKETRSYWFQIKSVLEGLSKKEKEGLFKNDPEAAATLKDLKNEFMQTTKQKFALENIILERTGFIPQKITEEFLINITIEGQDFDEKPMYIYIK